MRKLVRIAIVLFEIFALGNAILVAFLLGAWMESDTFAYSASELDWWLEAGKRFLVVVVISVVVSMIVWVVNKSLFQWLGFANAKLPGVTAAVTLFFLCLSGAAGAISFAYTKPYM